MLGKAVHRCGESEREGLVGCEVSTGGGDCECGQRELQFLLTWCEKTGCLGFLFLLFVFRRVVVLIVIVMLVWLGVYFFFYSISFFFYSYKRDYEG